MLDWSEDVEPWLGRQGVSTKGLDLTAICRKAAREAAPIEFCTCESMLSLGKPAQEALLCEYGIVRENNQLVRHSLWLAARVRQPHAVWSIPVALGPLDPPEPAAVFRIRLRAELQPDGLAVRVTEVPGSNCERGSEPSLDIPDYPERNAVRRREKAICAVRGEYTWQAGTFRKRAPARRGTSGP